jgi:hypothetical protein
MQNQSESHGLKTLAVYTRQCGCTAIGKAPRPIGQTPSCISGIPRRVIVQWGLNSDARSRSSSFPARLLIDQQAHTARQHRPPTIQMPRGAPHASEHASRRTDQSSYASEALQIPPHVPEHAPQRFQPPAPGFQLLNVSKAPQVPRQVPKYAPPSINPPGVRLQLSTGYKAAPRAHGDAPPRPPQSAPLPAAQFAPLATAWSAPLSAAQFAPLAAPQSVPLTAARPNAQLDPQGA